ncbi:MAG: hypothetical protein Q9164_006521 [Protoblastenia rupestris]
MVYTMDLWVDGGCRNNGYSNAVGAAAVVQVQRWGRDKIYTETLSGSRHEPHPTSQRAELAAVVLALQTAINKRDELDDNPRLSVNIHTDSRYAHSCMTEWYDKWENNGWRNARGEKVVNRDLVKKALELERDLLNKACVNWHWVPRDQNEAADKAVNDALDEEMDQDASRLQFFTSIALFTGELQSNFCSAAPIIKRNQVDYSPTWQSIDQSSPNPLQKFYQYVKTAMFFMGHSYLRLHHIKELQSHLKSDEIQRPPSEVLKIFDRLVDTLIRLACIGAAGAAAVVSDSTKSIITVRRLPRDPVLTNQRAELCGVILALHEAFVYAVSDPGSFIDVTIRTDSKYVYGCMTDWMSKWLLNGWLNAKGHPVANKDLLENIRQRQKLVERNGRVTYLWVPREQNQEADKAANWGLDHGEVWNSKSGEIDWQRDLRINPSSTPDRGLIRWQY